MVDSTTQVAIRFTKDDLALIEAIQAKTGISTRTDVLRVAIRKFAASEGVELPASRKRR